MGIKCLLAQLILSTGSDEMEKRSVSGGRVAAQGSYHSYGESCLKYFSNLLVQHGIRNCAHSAASPPSLIT